MTIDPGTTLGGIRERKPLVHNITNYVVMNETANAILALGALPVMAHAQEEVAEMVGLAGALVLNIGTLSEPWIDAMLLAGKAANERSIPVVLDPVGVGATAYRTETAQRLLDEIDIAVLRGNAGEVATLAGFEAEVRGVEYVGDGGDQAEPRCRRRGHGPRRSHLRRRAPGLGRERTPAARFDHGHGLYVDRDHGLLPRRQGRSVRGCGRGTRGVRSRRRGRRRRRQRPR